MKILDDPAIENQIEYVKNVMQNGGIEGKAAIVTIIAIAGFGIIGLLGALLWVVRG